MKFTRKNGNRKHKKTLKKKPAHMKFDDLDYATDIDVLTIMSKEKQIAALNKVKQYLRVCKKNKSHVKEMIKRKQQIQELISEH
jgi:hypothetical protein